MYRKFGICNGGISFGATVDDDVGDDNAKDMSHAEIGFCYFRIILISI